MLFEQSNLLINSARATFIPYRTIAPKKEKQKAVLIIPSHDDFRIPPWCLFNPSDIELILLFLKPKLMNKPSPFPHNRVRIREASCLHSPAEIAGTEREAYFFCSRYRENPDKEWSNRAASNGYWKAIEADSPINYKDLTIGFRQTLVFYEGVAPEGNITTWTMHEYRVFEPESGPSNTEKNNNVGKEFEYILCKIYNRASTSLRRGKVDQVGEGDVNRDCVRSCSSSIFSSFSFRNLISTNWDRLKEKPN